MKHCIALLLFFGSSAFAFCRDFPPPHHPEVPRVSPLVQLPVKLRYDPPGLRTRNMGRTLTLAGAGMAGVGLLIIKRDNKRYSSTQSASYEENFNGLIGVLMLHGGIAMSIPGVVCWSSGAQRYKRYLKEHTPSASLNIKPNGIGFMYKF